MKPEFLYAIFIIVLMFRHLTWSKDQHCVWCCSIYGIFTSKDDLQSVEELFITTVISFMFWEINYLTATRRRNCQNQFIEKKKSLRSRLMIKCFVYSHPFRNANSDLALGKRSSWFSRVFGGTIGLPLIYITETCTHYWETQWTLNWNNMELTVLYYCPNH